MDMCFRPLLGWVISLLLVISAALNWTGINGACHFIPVQDLGLVLFVHDRKTLQFLITSHLRDSNHFLCHCIEWSFTVSLWSRTILLSLSWQWGKLLSERSSDFCSGFYSKSEQGRNSGRALISSYSIVTSKYMVYDEIQVLYMVRYKKRNVRKYLTTHELTDPKRRRRRRRKY